MKRRHAFAMLVLASTLVAISRATASTGTATNAAPADLIVPPCAKTAVGQALEEKHLDKRLQRLSDLGAGLSLSEIPDALEVADGLPELRERMVLKQAVLIRWSELAPEGAFDWIAALPENQLKASTLREAVARFARKAPAQAAAAAAGMRRGRTRNDAIVLVANLWAETNVSAALEWAGKLPDSFAKEAALDAIRYVWVHADPVGASGHVEKLQPGATRNNLIANAAYEWAALDPQAAIRWISRLPDGPDKDAGLANVAESWANSDPPTAAAFALKLPPGEVRAQAGALVALRWAKQDPRRAAEWAWRSGDAEVRRRSLKEVLELWAAVDSAESAKWIASLPPGPERDQTIPAFALAASPWDPQAAAQVSFLIQDEADRLQVLDQCLPQWQEVDPVSFTNWLRSAKLPEALKTRWLKPVASP